MVDVGRYGRDHWSMLAYLETRAVDSRGKVDSRNVRTDFTRHPLLGAGMNSGLQLKGHDYPTRLKDGELLRDHDDWDCIWDLQTAGFVRITAPRQAAHYFDVEPGCRGPIKNPAGGWPRKGTTYKAGAVGVVVRLTDAGHKVSAQIREHKAQGKNYAEFSLV